jgi:hypothetical protein
MKPVFGSSRSFSSRVAAVWSGTRASAFGVSAIEAAVVDVAVCVYQAKTPQDRSSSKCGSLPIDIRPAQPRRRPPQSQQSRVLQPWHHNVARLLASFLPDPTNPVGSGASGEGRISSVLLRSPAISPPIEATRRFYAAFHLGQPFRLLRVRGASQTTTEK